MTYPAIFGLMDADAKKYLAGKLVSLLEEAGESQTALAEFAGTKQGQVADHLRGRAYPKMVLLLRYWLFFNRRLDRALTLYELTGLDAVSEFEQELKSQAGGDATAAKILAAYRSLATDDPRRKAIDALLQVGEESEHT